MFYFLSWAAIAAAAASGEVVFKHEVSFALLQSPLSKQNLANAQNDTRYQARNILSIKMFTKYVFLETLLFITAIYSTRSYKQHISRGHAC